MYWSSKYRNPAMVGILVGIDKKDTLVGNIDDCCIKIRDKPVT